MDSECHTPGQAFGGTEPLGLDIQIYISYKGTLWDSEAAACLGANWGESI